MENRPATKIIAALFIFLLTYTAINKLVDLDGFRAVLKKSPLLSGASSAISWLVPISELQIAGLLLSPRTRKIGLYASSLLMFTFTVYVSYMVALSKHLPCSCGGVIGHLSWKGHILFNICFLLLAIKGSIMASKKPL